MQQPDAPLSDRPAASRYDEAVERFVTFWGEMGSNWGVNRTMAQIHALLYCTEEPLDTDAIMERLGISRGNANMNLRSLVSWRLAYKVSRPGSRKDYFEGEKDVWAITARIIEERERREIRPVKEQLNACRNVLSGKAEDGADRPEEDLSEENLSEEERVLGRRLENLALLMEVFEGFSEALLPLVKKHDVKTIKNFIHVAAVLQGQGEQGDQSSTSNREDQS